MTRGAGRHSERNFRAAEQHLLQNDRETLKEEIAYPSLSSPDTELILR